MNKLKFINYVALLLPDITFALFLLYSFFLPDKSNKSANPPEQYTVGRQVHKSATSYITAKYHHPPTAVPLTSPSFIGIKSNPIVSD